MLICVPAHRAREILPYMNCCTPLLIHGDQMLSHCTETGVGFCLYVKDKRRDQWMLWSLGYSQEPNNQNFWTHIVNDLTFPQEK